MNFKDKKGDLYDGKSVYRLKVPKDVPAKEFWSAIAYSVKTKGFIKGTKPVGLSSQDKSLKANADGTHDIYFSPKAPKEWSRTGSRPARISSSSSDSTGLRRALSSRPGSWATARRLHNN